MNPSAGFACPFDEAETVIAVDDDKPSSIDPSAAFAESLSQANATWPSRPPCCRPWSRQP